MSFKSPPFIQAICKRKINLICIILSLFVYILNNLFLINVTSGWLQNFCQSHLNDLFCPLFLLGFSQILFVWAECEINTYINCVLFGMACGCVWEYFAPLINPNAVSDPWDLLCYFIGINIYYFIYKATQNAPE